MSYKYYDTPDGQDCVKKLFYTTKKAGIYGIGLSSFWVILVDTPPTYGQILARYALITGPCVAAAVAGTMSVCTLVQSREKDDEWNHFFGGLIGGIAGGLAKSHVGHGIYAGLLGGMCFAAYKHCKLNNYNVWPTDTPFSTDDHWSIANDWRISKDLPKDWIAK